MRAGWEKWSNSGNEMIKVWFVASIYIHLAEKIDGKTTRCKSRNQRTLLENCPNTEFSTSSVTKFLFFFQRRGGGTYSMRKKPLDLNILSFSLSRNFLEGGWQLPCFHALLFIFPRFSILPDGLLFYFCEFTIVTLRLIRWNKNRFREFNFRNGDIQYLNTYKRDQF